jgi:hypothetical protein
MTTVGCYLSIKSLSGNAVGTDDVRGVGLEDMIILKADLKYLSVWIGLICLRIRPSGT